MGCASSSMSLLQGFWNLALVTAFVCVFILFLWALCVVVYWTYRFIRRDGDARGADTKKARREQLSTYVSKTRSRVVRVTGRTEAGSSSVGENDSTCT